MWDLKRQRISTDREVKMQRVWVDGELKKCAMAAQVQQVEGCLSELATVKEQVPYPMDVQECIEDLYEWRGELEERAMAAQVRPVEGCFSELAAVKEQVSRMEQQGCVVVALVEQWQAKVSETQAGGLTTREMVHQVEGRMKGLVTGEQLQQVEERMGALEVGLAAQVRRAEESMSEIKLQRVWVEGELKDGAMAVQVEERMKGLEWGLAAQAKHAAGSMSEIRLQRDAEGSRSEIKFKRVCSIMADVESQGKQRNKSLLEEGQKLQGRLRAVEDKPDMTERLESIERSVQVCVNSVRVLHSYAEANGSSDSDGEDT